MQSILNLSKTNKLILATFAFLAVLAFGSGRAHAATITVGSGCTLPQAIQSVNGGSAQGSCGGTGYGTNDTINIPAGTITLGANLAGITEPVTIQGAGMGQTTVSGDGDYSVFASAGADQVTVSGLTVTAPRGCAISFLNTDAVLNNVEVDGAGATKVGNNYCGVSVVSDTGSYTVDSNNLYVHNFDASGTEYVEGILINPYDGTTIDVDLQNTTFADIHAGSGGVNGIFMGAGFLQSGGGHITANIINTTVDDVTSTGVTAPFANVAFADGADASVTAVINNITITGTRGVPGSGFLTGLNTAAFYAVGMGSGAGDTGTVNVSVGNSLMADNQSNSTPSNCFEGDLTSNFSGSGTAVTNITSLGHNISDDNSCGFTQSGDQHNVANIISTLGPLQNNGGAVPTRALLAGSPAITAGGSVLGVTTDARGIARPGTCPSVGAFQYVGAVCAASTTNAGGTNAGAPNTGVNPVSMISTVIAGFAGLATISVTSTKLAAERRKSEQRK